MIEKELKEKSKIILKEVFGYDSYRGTQEATIESILSKKNTFVIMPTGGGKSLCYQLPALLFEGTAIVISPLIALMKNQVDQMKTLAINAQFLNSTLNKSELNKVKEETLSGQIKLLYVAPESLTKEVNIDFLQQSKISFVAIDEAHCISEWGHDFRPEYRKIKKIIEDVSKGDKIPVIALTATATPKVQLDIIKNLGIENANLFKSSFNRHNLFYEVRPKKNAKKHLIQIVNEYRHKSGIVYCMSRKKVDEIAEFLTINNIKAVPYHAGMESKARIKNQDAFLNEDVDVVVATIAFGMGIDKPDVRFVIHYDTPKSIESYYQETGRAGRDGLEGKCILFYSHNDIEKLEKYNKDKSVTERENARFLLDEMTSYVESAVCRRKQLIHYFGEEYTEKNCESCDNCVNPKETIPGIKYIELVIKTVKHCESRFEMDHIVNIIIGKESEHVLSHKHNKLDVFKKGKDETATFWKSVVRQTLFYEFLEKDINKPSVFKVTAKGQEFIEDPYPITLTKDHEYDLEGEEEETEKEQINTKSYDTVLFEMLKSLCKKIAKQENLPPYVIFQEPSLEEMAILYPTDIESLKKIIGVGESKAKKFGTPFIELITKYVEENDIITVQDVVVKSAGIKSKNKILIIQLIDKKIDLEEIAEMHNFKYHVLIDEIENICYSGIKLNLNYYIDQILSPKSQSEIYEYFMNAKTDSIDDAYEELGEDYSEEELRLMRIKFMSEFAH